MAEKIKPAGDADSSAQSLLDVLFSKSDIGLTDAEARILLAMWKNSPRGSQHLAAPGADESKTVSALKVKGYLSGYGSGVELTEKGRKAIVEMVTHEPNAFSKKAQALPYSGIKAKNAKGKARPRQAFKKTASRQGKVFNLRKESLRRLGE
jgi:hypothetical protein